MTSIEPMNLESEDLVASRIEQLKALFPEIATEGDGTVDFEKLRLIMGDEVNEDDERYAFTWPGKRDAIRQSQTPSTATLRPAVDESRSRNGEDGSFDSDNLYIEGDNLEVLKLLQHSYHGKVKMIYIDPPYNTGHDFVYKDSFGDTIGNYKEQAGLSGQANADTSGRYHSDWCSMMYPRLKLARELLTDDGVMYVSIDEHELSNLLTIIEEVFGFGNFEVLIWRKNSKQGNTKKITRFKNTHEYIIVGYKDKSQVGIGKVRLLPNWKSEKSNPDNDPRGPWESGVISRNEEKSRTESSNFYALTLPSGRVIEREFYVSRKELEALIADKRIYFPKDGDGVPRLKIFENEEQEYYFDSVIDEMGTFTDARAELEADLKDKEIFSTPKPKKLLKELIRATACDDSIVLDFFSGSSSFALAVTSLNAEENKNITAISVQLSECCDESSIAFQYGYKNICEIGKERIRQVGSKISDEIKKSNMQMKFGENQKPIPDIGFRVFKLDDSGINKQDLNAAAERGELFGGDSLLDSVVKPSRSDLDIVFEMMLKWGLELTLPVEKTTVDGYKCYVVAGGELICCMKQGLTVEALEAIADIEPRRVLMLDSILTDTLKLNAVQIFKRVGDRTGVEVELRTV